MGDPGVSLGQCSDCCWWHGGTVSVCKELPWKKENGLLKQKEFQVHGWVFCFPRLF